ncbi:MAG: translation initiation factor IF-2 [Elusimicrobiota bacterium]
MPQKKSKTSSDKPVKSNSSDIQKKKKTAETEQSLGGGGHVSHDHAPAKHGAVEEKPAKARVKKAAKKASAEETQAKLDTKTEKTFKKAKTSKIAKIEPEQKEPTAEVQAAEPVKEESRFSQVQTAFRKETKAPIKIEPQKKKVVEKPRPPVQHQVKAPEKHKIAPAPEKKHEPEPAAPKPVETPVALPLTAPPLTVPSPPAPISLGEIKINELITVRELSEKIRLRPGDVLKKLLSMGSLATINQRLERDIAVLLAHEFGYEAKFETIYGQEAATEEKESADKLKPRPPVVTVMGHVDHGKTSLLDVIRSTNVAQGEAGGITQHIGAYSVKTSKGEVTFLDTPGHEAFTAMRSRGAKVTDLVVLVVSASDGVMPQTVEAIDHARAANVPIIVAINKIDIAGANPEQIKQELNKYNVIPEDWGGDTIMVEVSAKKNINIEQLLEMILLKAELMELKANPDRMAKGAVIEAKLDPRRGPVATVLVQTGTLKVSDNFVVGTTFGKVRAMTDDHGRRLNEVFPGRPAEILGITSAPQAGDQFIVVEDERVAREISRSRQNRAKEDALRPRHHLSLEDISLGKTKDLRVILKTDVQGSLGALSDSLEKLSTSEINLKLIHRGVGSITESDVMLAASSDAMIIGFNIRPEAASQKLADKEGVSIRVYRIIYEVISEIRAAMEGLLEPEVKEVVIGKALVRQVFKTSKAGTVAGSAVTDGKIQRSSFVRLLRDNVIVYQGSLASLRRFKDDVKEVDKGFECGIALENFADIKQGDVLEVYIKENISRKLEG